MTLEQEKRELDRQRRIFDRERKAFKRRVEVENRRLERENELIEMKAKLLEEELVKLAAERQEIAKKKVFYEYVAQHEARQKQIEEAQVVRGELFFVGVGTKQSLKKRYKDLVKIYHPDNTDGDNNTILEINREYDYLCQKFG